MMATGAGWTMHLGDCLDVATRLDRVDHVITDPPYEAEAHTKARRALVEATQIRGTVRAIDQALEVGDVVLVTAGSSKGARGRVVGRLGSFAPGIPRMVVDLPDCRSRALRADYLERVVGES